MRRFEHYFIWAAGVMLALGLGIYAGQSVTTAYKDTELKDLQAQLETAQASLADVNIELEQNRVLILAWDALASYYTEQESGGMTASGREYDHDQLTAAHRTLKFGTILIVENPENGKVSPVRITDRGPAEWTGRSLDVSLAVAKRLGIVNKGVARLRCYYMIAGRPSH